MTVKLESKFLKLEAMPEAGGNILSLKARSRRSWVDLFRPADGPAIAARDPQGMGCFASIPYVSRITHGEFGFDGRKYIVPPNQPPSPHPLHGYVWRHPGEVAEESKTRFTILHRCERDDYPFRFRSWQSWRLSDPRTLEVKLSVENTGERAMPFGLGLHPFFKKTPGCALQALVDCIILNDADVRPTAIRPVPPQQSFSSDFRRLSDLPVDNCFTGWMQNYDIAWPEYDLGLHVTADSTFRFLVVCSPPGTDWFCVNPVSHYNDALNNPLGIKDTGLKILQKGETLSGSVWMELRG